MLDLRKGVFHPRTGAGNAGVAFLLALAQRLATWGLALDMFAVTQSLEHFTARCAGVALVGIHIPAGVAIVQHLVKVRAVVLAGGARGDLADELVADVHADAQLVAVVALAVFLGVRGVQILLPAFGWAPVAGHLALIEQRLLLLGEVLDGRGYQGGVDDLPAAGDVAMAQQLRVCGLKQRRRAINAQALLVVPDGVAIGYVGAVREQAKALEAHAIEQLVLHLFVRQVVEVLEHQDAHHDRGGVWRAPTLAGVGPGTQAINDARQVVKVDVFGDDLQRVAQRLDLALACLVGEQVELDGAARARLVHEGNCRACWVAMRTTMGGF